VGAHFPWAKRAGNDGRMLGAVILAVVIVVVLPVGMTMGGAVIASVLGWSLKSDGDERFEGSELVELNR
jgi:hypothetical protein